MRKKRVDQWMRGARFYLPLIATAATAAAAMGHFAIGWLASAGAFSGTYALYRHGTVAFSATVVCAVVGAFATCASIEALRHRFADREDIVRPIGDPTIVAYIAALAAQFAVLFVLETLEQVWQFGHPLGYAAWLGGPPLVAIAIQTVVGIASTLFAYRAAKAIVSVTMALASAAAPLFRRSLVARQAPRSTASLRAERAQLAARLVPPLASRLANRPPPVASFT